MAHKKCKKCGHPISTDEGHARPVAQLHSPRKKRSIWLYAVFGALFLCAVFLGWISTTTQQPTAETPAQIAARTADNLRRATTDACMKILRKKLYDPDSATFAHTETVEFSANVDRAMVIQSVLAKNAFGTMRLTEFVCLLDIDEKNIRVFSIAERGRDTRASQAFVAEWLKRGQ